MTDRSSSHRRTAVVAALTLVLALLLAGGRPESSEAAEADRVAGASRIETAAAIAQRSFPDGASRVFLARADVLADALAAGPLTEGPVLLVPACGEVPAAVTEQIARLDPSSVTALGGPQAVCDDLLAAAGAGRPTDRLAGPSRFDTAVALSREVFPDGADEVYLASALDSPDAVAAGSLTGGPLLLVPSDGSAPQAVLDEIARLDPAKVVVLGGEQAVSPQVVEQAVGDRASLRLAGASRLDTAVAIAEYQFDAPDGPGSTDAGTVYLARADVFADAVAAGSLADGPIVLVPTCGDLPPAVAAELGRTRADQVIALGGVEAVCGEILEAAVAAAEDPTVLTPDAEVLTAAERDSVDEYDADTGVLRFDGSASTVDGIEAGDVVVSAASSAAPEGLLRRSPPPSPSTARSRWRPTRPSSPISSSTAAPVDEHRSSWIRPRTPRRWAPGCR